MQDSNVKFKIINSFIAGGIAAIIFIVTATIVGELVASFKDFLKNIFGHHWIGKSVIGAAIFAMAAFLCFLCPKKFDIEKTIFWLWALILAAIAGFFAIFGFYIGHFYGIF